MCGIAGIVGGPRPEPGDLARMAEAMAHRGPDGEGVWSDETCGLAFRRLAIIDLDPRSDQPMHLGPWHLAFNGEIYNYRELRAELEGLGHRFVTEGDGEVLLHAWAEWEEGALERFNGMFAFAVWHDERRELVLACDPFGEKPVFWAQDGERLLFASDVRAMAEVDPAVLAPDEAALGPFVALGLFPPIERTFFARVRRLPGAHVLRLRDGRVDVRRYWQPAPVAVPSDYGAAVAHLRELLTDSIRLRLRSDVPVGTSLSGGIDSSAIVGLAGHMAADATRHAFTARFRGFERDEWDYAAQVAAGAGVVEHHCIEPSPGEMLDDLDRLVADQEEPFGSLSIYVQWRVMRAAHEAGVTVLLDGQGADELFGGYEWVTGWALRTGGARRLAGSLAGPERLSVLRAIVGERMPRALARRYRHRFASPYAAAGAMAAAVAIEAPAGPGARGADPLRRELLRQTFHTSLPQLLRYADRDSMAHGREVRLPFLDRRIAEFALSAPAEFLYRDGFTKAILRDAVRDVAPAAVLARRDKIGYEPPQARWLSESAAIARMRDVLLDPAARSRGTCDAAAIEADAAAGRWRDPAGAWRALNVELWLRAFAARPRHGAASAAA
jgi:asparagine synthase (glutamine-hydrolysing)